MTVGGYIVINIGYGRSEDKRYKAAEALAFELYELCHRRQETMVA